MLFRFSTRRLTRFVDGLMARYEKLGYKVQSDQGLGFFIDGKHVIFLYNPIEKSLVALVADKDGYQDSESYAPVACLYSALGAQHKELEFLHSPITSKALEKQTLANYTAALDAIFAAADSSKGIRSLIDAHKGHVHPFLH